ncbi:hypothetical protein [Nonomuraea sp. NPDC050786]
MCWLLGPKTPEQPDPYNFLELRFSKFQWMAFEGGSVFGSLRSHE